MNNQELQHEQQAEKVVKEGNKVNSDTNHATQITQKALDEVNDVSQGAEEGDVEDTFLEDAEELI